MAEFFTPVQAVTAVAQADVTAGVESFVLRQEMVASISRLRSRAANISTSLSTVRVRPRTRRTPTPCTLHAVHC